MPALQRFNPSWGLIARESALVALGAGALLMGFLWAVRGESRPGVLALFGLGAAAFAALVYAAPALRRGLAAVEVDAERLRVVDRQGTREVRWADVHRVDHAYRGGDRWQFVTREDARPFHVRLEGFTVDEAHAVSIAIRERLRAHGVRGEEE